MSDRSPATASHLSYLLLHAPVLGVPKGPFSDRCILVLFPAAPRWNAETETLALLSAAERRMSVLLGVTLLLWITGAWHGIPPAWIGPVAACAGLLPRAGFLAGDDF